VRPFFIRSLPMHSFGRRPRRVGRARSSGTREEATSSNYMVLLPAGGSRPRSLGRGPGSSIAVVAQQRNYMSRRGSYPCRPRHWTTGDGEGHRRRVFNPSSCVGHVAGETAATIASSCRTSRRQHVGPASLHPTSSYLRPSSTLMSACALLL